MLHELQEVAVAADDVVGEAIRGGCDVDVVGRIGSDDTARHFTLNNNGKAMAPSASTQRSSSSSGRWKYFRTLG
jgi:hypothetical protein